MSLASVFSNGCVLQRDREIIIFGHVAGPITVSFLGETHCCTEPGAFEMHFSAHPAGGPYSMIVQEDGKTRIISDILLGDIYIVGGQSNAQLKLKDTDWLPDDCTGDDFARVYQCRKLMDADAFDDSWHPLTATNAFNWSSIGLHLAKDLRRDRGIPIGIVCVYQGASVIQSFLSPDTAERFMYPLEQMAFSFRHERHRYFNRSCMQYFLMVQPLFPFGVKGVVWYQGEGNASVIEGNHFHEMLKTLVNEWRNGFRNPVLSFIVIQINDIAQAKCPEGVALIQKAQEKAVQEMEHVALVPIRDMGHFDELHPVNKHAVAERVYDALLTIEGLSKNTLYQ